MGSRVTVGMLSGLLAWSATDGYPAPRRRLARLSRNLATVDGLNDVTRQAADLGERCLITAAIDVSLVSLRVARQPGEAIRHPTAESVEASTDPESPPTTIRHPGSTVTATNPREQAHPPIAGAHEYAPGSARLVLSCAECLRLSGSDDGSGTEHQDRRWPHRGVGER